MPKTKKLTKVPKSDPRKWIVKVPRTIKYKPSKIA